MPASLLSHVPGLSANSPGTSAKSRSPKSRGSGGRRSRGCAVAASVCPPLTAAAELTRRRRCSRRNGARSQMTEKRILLVEDEADLRKALALGLRRAGYQVDIAASAAEAQQLIEAQSYALVLADWQLPDGNGIDLADLAVRGRAKTLIISGFAIGFSGGAGGGATVR